MQLSTALDKWVAYLRSVGKSEATIEGYRQDLRLFKDHVIYEHGRDRITYFTRETIEAWLLHQRERGLVERTVARRQTALQQFARWGRKQRYWLEDPTEQIDRIKTPRSIPRPFESHQRNTLMRLSLSLREAAMRALFYFSGVRVSELAGIQVRHVVRPDGDEPGKLIVYRGKGRKEREVPLHPEAWAALEAWGLQLADNSPNAYVFPNTTGGPLRRQTIEKMTRRWGRLAGIDKCAPHRFRHTFATDYLKQPPAAHVEPGDLLLDLSHQLGHANVATTMIYTKVNRERLKAGVLALPSFGNVAPDYCIPGSLPNFGQANSSNDADLQNRDRKK